MFSSCVNKKNIILCSVQHEVEEKFLCYYEKRNLLNIKRVPSSFHFDFILLCCIRIHACSNTLLQPLCIFMALFKKINK